MNTSQTLRAVLLGKLRYFPLLFVLFSIPPSSLSAQDDTFQKTVAPFLKEHCVSCHGPKRQESRLRLDTVARMDATNRNMWTLIHERIDNGEMPPKNRPRPDAAESAKLLKWIVVKQRTLGIDGTRRLNRRELSAALQELTGLSVDFSYGLPGDGTVGGFDTGADGLQEASDALVQWLQVTRRAVAGIHFLEPAKGKTFSAHLSAVKKQRGDPWRKLFDEWNNMGARIRQSRSSTLPEFGKGLLLMPRAPGERNSWNFHIPPPPSREGILRMTLEVSAMQPMKGLPNPHLWVKIGGKAIDFREITATSDEPITLVYEVQIGDLVVESRGVNIDLSNRVEIPYGVKGFQNEDRTNPKDPPPGGANLYRPKYDRKKLPPEEQPVPFIIIRKIHVEPDVTVAWPPAAWKANVGTIEDNDESAKKLLTLWINRAWRRPVSEAEQAPFFNLYKKLRGKRMTFDKALRASFQSVLMSAPFRYQASPGHDNKRLAQYAIASRLSFFLHGTPPDARLLSLAEAGKLGDPKVLDAQVDRLLEEQERDGFIRPFVMQWLELEQPITIVQNHIQQQDFRFGRYLKESMREETIAYITRLIEDNRPAKELIDSDWTMMNDTLARHYGYPPIRDGKLRKVQLRKDDPRGGILGHAGIQSMLCWMGDNWVIYRGAWTARHILDTPPPPPPLDVPELDPNDGKFRGKPVREVLKIHMEDHRCAVCHRTIDPLGYAYQNFDISGRWRDVEHERYSRNELDGRIAWKGEGKTRDVDSAGHFPRGEKYNSFTEFKNILVKHYQADMVRGILKNLLIYSTGRIPGIEDRKEIRAIMETHRPKGYPLRDLIKAVVRSRAFLESYERQPAILGRPE